MEALGSLESFAELMAGRYPKMVTTSVQVAVIQLLGQIGFVVWAILLLVRP